MPHYVTSFGFLHPWTIEFTNRAARRFIHQGLLTLSEYCTLEGGFSSQSCDSLVPFPYRRLISKQRIAAVTIRVLQVSEGLCSIPL